MEVLQRTANRGSVSTGGYEVANSVKNEPDNGERFDTGVKFTNYSSVRKFTVSTWLKRTELGAQSLVWFNVSTATAVQLQFEAGDYLSIILQDNVGNGVESYSKTSALFRDTSAYYHVILAVDTTDGTAANRTKIYINGVNQTLVQGNGAYDTFPAQNYDVPLQTRHYLLGYDGGNNGFRGYAAEYYFLDGITASPTDFGEYDEDSGIWKPIEYTGGFGNEGYYLDFEDASALGKDVSSNNQGNFTHYGGSAADQATDTPTNNFCTMSPLWAYAYPMTIIEGGTKLTGSQDQWQGAKSTFGVTSGKWYWEVKIGTQSDSGFIGIQTDGESNISSGNSQSQNTTYCRKLDGGDIFFIGGSESSASNGGGNAGNNDIIGVALDLDSGTKTIKWFKNNSAYGGTIDLANASTSFTTREVFPFHAMYGSATNNQYNFGGYTSATPSSASSDANGYGTFEYAPPTGYYALCTKNLAEYG